MKHFNFFFRFALKSPPVEFLSLLSRLLGVAAHDFDPIRLDVDRVVELEVDVFDQERPNIVTETVGIEMALEAGKIKSISLATLNCR